MVKCIHNFIFLCSYVHFYSYESNENMTISCSTKVCSFGKQVVEKVETELARFENGRYVYRIHRSAMCEYMINFIHKLKHLPEKYMMNSVLENFTILQVLFVHFDLPWGMPTLSYPPLYPSKDVCRIMLLFYSIYLRTEKDYCIFKGKYPW